MVDFNGLFSQVDIEVKRQVWDMEVQFFVDEVSAVLTRYVDEKNAQLSVLDCNLNNFFAANNKVCL